MALLVDTSVWSLDFRRDADSNAPQVAALRTALGGAETIVTTGLVRAGVQVGTIDVLLAQLCIRHEL